MIIQIRLKIASHFQQLPHEPIQRQPGKLIAKYKAASFISLM